MENFHAAISSLKQVFGRAKLPTAPGLCSIKRLIEKLVASISN